MPNAYQELGEDFPMSRPKILVTTAKIGAARYRRERDLPGAIAGLLSRPSAEILPRLREAEQQCEEERRAQSAAYRPGKHVQIFAALLAEAARAARSVQPKASGSDALRSAT